MKIQNNHNQSFKAKLVNFKPIINKCAKDGLSEKSIKRALDRIHRYFPDQKDSVIIAEQGYSIFTKSTGVGVLKSNGVFRFTEIPLENNKNDLYRIVSAVKKLTNAVFTKDMDFTSID